jgi:hypothetical protein
MKSGNTKIGTRIWTPVAEKFKGRMDSVCLRRDAMLTKVLDEELDALDREVAEPNSEAAHKFIAARLDALPRKLVTFTLPEELIGRLDGICQRKRIVRDSFFNRLFFLLVADYRLITHLFFEGNKEWFHDLLEKTDFSSSAAGDLLDPIPDFRNPFSTIREGLRIDGERLAEEAGIAGGPDQWISDRRIYTAPITDKLSSKIDLSGLNVYLPDWLVPGVTQHYGVPVDLSEFLDYADEPPTAVSRTEDPSS